MIFASKEKTKKDSGKTYGTKLLQNMMLHALSTGLKDGNIRHSLESTLKRDDVTDEELIATLNAITTREEERKSHFLKVNQLTVEPEKRGNDEIFGNDLKRLEAEVALLKENIKQKNGDGNSSSNYKKEKQIRRCKWCENGTDRYDHCFKCGSTEHFARGCKQKKIPATGKLSGTTLKGQSVVQGEAPLCNHCMKENPKQLCTGCRTAFYCLKKSLIKIVGDKYTLKCEVEGKGVNFLRDTGAQVSILPSIWLNEHFQGKEVLPLEELFDRKIAIKAASGDNIPFDGCVHLNLKAGVDSIPVSFLVTNLEIEIPILGFNVISHIRDNCQEQNYFNFFFINVLPCSDAKMAESVSSILAEDMVSMGQVKCG